MTSLMAVAAINQVIKLLLWCSISAQMHIMWILHMDNNYKWAVYLCHVLSSIAAFDTSKVQDCGCSPVDQNGEA